MRRMAHAMLCQEICKASGTRPMTPDDFSTYGKLTDLPGASNTIRTPELSGVADAFAVNTDRVVGLPVLLDSLYQALHQKIATKGGSRQSQLVTPIQKC